jgi:hypothetical protein
MYRLPGHLGGLEAEYAHPIYQYLEGTQVTTDGGLAVRYLKTS